jgi:hypothetical protein
MIFSFGKYRGHSVSKVPTSYLAWCLDEGIRLNLDLRAEILSELANRLNVPPQIITRTAKTDDSKWRSDIRDWCRKASAICHPDVGGSVAMQTLVNQLRDYVSK